MSDSKRFPFVDFLRGVAIFLMLWGHSIQYSCGGQFDFFENIVFKTIYSFHMPFFMLISGFLFWFSEQNRGLVELIEYKTKTLLYPILICSVLNFLLSTSIDSLFRREFNSIIGESSLNSAWFLWSLIACSIALTLTVKVVKNRLLQIIIFVLGFQIVALFPQSDMNIYMYPYFVLGYLFSRNILNLKKGIHLGGIVSTISFVVMMFFFEKKHYIYTSGLHGEKVNFVGFSIDIFRWTIGLLGSISIIYICWLLYGFISKAGITKFVENIGKESLAMYLLSISLLSFWLKKIFDHIFVLLPCINWNNNILLYNFIITPLIAIAYLIGIFYLIKLLKKIRLYRLIFGR